MYITPRTILAALAVIPLIVFSTDYLEPFMAAVIYNAVVLFVIIVDLILTPGASGFKFERIIEERFSLGVENRVLISVKPLTSLWRQMVIVDDYPDGFTADRKEMSVRIAGRGDFIGEYTVVPNRRGMYQFGPIRVRVSGGFGFAGRQFEVEQNRTVRVYPDIHGISAYRIFAGKNKILMRGGKPSRIKGMGTDFEYLREYQPDDEYRKINWKATARRSRLITSQFQADRSQNIFIIIDGGRMMMSRIKGMTKLDYAMNSALLLAFSAMEKGDNAGVMVFDNEIRAFLPPERGKNQMNRIIESLFDLEPRMVEPDYGKAVRYLGMKNKKRSLMVFLTDLIDEEVSKAAVTYLGHLHPVHMPLCVAISDPSIKEEAEKSPRNSKDIYRRAVALDLLSRREQVMRTLEANGVLTLDSNPEELSISLLNRYLTVKNSNRL